MISLVRIACAACLAFIALTPHSVANAAEAPEQAVIHGSGCGDPLKISAISRSGEIEKSRSIVKGKPGFQLTARAVSTDDQQILFTSYDCDTNEQTLYRQFLGRRPTAEALMALPRDWWFVGVTWDIARGAPAVLIRDPGFSYFLQVQDPSGWSTVWSGSRADFDGKFPDDLVSRSGYEFLIVADDLGGEWAQFRVNTSGKFRPYMNKELTGPGRMNEIADGAPLGRNKSLIGEDGSYICDWSARGTIQDAITQGKCTPVIGGAGFYGVLAKSEYPKDWLFTYGGLGSTMRHEFECVGETIVSCGSPVVGKRERSTLSGSGFAYVDLGTDGTRIKTKFKKLGASTI